MKKLALVLLLISVGAFGQGTPTPTNTNTITRTPTITNTPTRTGTRTATPTRTATITKTFTAANTPTKTFTITRTPTITQTPTITRTPTHTYIPASGGVSIGATTGTVSAIVSSFPLGNADVLILEVTWGSNASGAAYIEIVGVKGDLEHIDIAPGTGAVVPTNSYDMVLNNSMGVDLMQTGGANVSSTVPKGLFTGKWPVPVTSRLYLSVSNAGDSKQGTVKLYISRW